MAKLTLDELHHQPARLQDYIVAVDYRTNSGGNTRRVRVAAGSESEAFDKANAKVRRARGVVTVDGGTLEAVLPFVRGGQ